MGERDDMVTRDPTSAREGTPGGGSKPQVDVAELHRRIDELLARLELQHKQAKEFSQWRYALLIPVVGILAMAGTFGVSTWRRRSGAWALFTRGVRARLGV